VSGSPVQAPPAEPSLVDAAEVARSLGVDPASGLRSAEATERLARIGPNRLDPAAQVPTGRKLLAQFADPLIYLLLAAIVISVVAWALEGAQVTPGLGRRHVPVLLLGSACCQGGSRTLTPRRNGTPHCRLCYLEPLFAGRPLAATGATSRHRGAWTFLVFRRPIHTSIPNRGQAQGIPVLT
jgi:hypothetical protein